MPIKLSVAPQQFVDDSGKPIAGRVTFLYHGTGERAEIYTMQGNDFVLADNPQLLNAMGSLDDTVFFNADILDMKVERYLGEPGGMTVNAPNTMWAPFDTFQVGMDYKALIEQRGTVGSIDELKQVDPSEFSAVTVQDVPWRTYVWDPMATNTADDGIVVQSDVDGNGRWLLLWDDEMLPASVYGVKDGHVENISALLNYPEIVGSIGLRTPPVVRFERGDYPLVTSITGTKTVAFSRGVKFTGGNLMIPTAIALTEVDGYVCDFRFSSVDTTAHSSWFRTLTGFWTCGACRLVVDNANYFTSTLITSTVGLEEKVVEGNGTCATGYSTNSYFAVSSGTVIPGGFFKASDYVRVKSDMSDAMFGSGAWDPGLISSGHHQQFDTQPTLARWGAVSRWAAVMIERKARMGSLVTDELNFENRTLANLTLEGNTFTTLSNAVFTGTLTVKSSVLTLRNVRGTVSVGSSSNLVLMVFDSDITLSQNHTGLDTIAARDSRITVPGSAGIDPADVQVSLANCTYNGAIYLSDAHADAYAEQKPLSLVGCEIPDGLRWRVNQILVQDSTIYSKIDILPYKSGSDYLYSVNIQNCHFLGASRVWLTVYATQSSWHNDLDAHVKFGRMHIVDNMFDTTDAYGIKMMFWHPLTMNRLVSDNVGSWNYYGNRGKCPRLEPGYIIGADSFPNEQGTNQKWKVTTDEYNVWCPYAWFADGSLYCVDTDPSGLGIAPSPVALVTSMSSMGNNPSTCYYAYRRYTTLLNDYTDENENNMFRVLVGVGYRLPSVTSFENSWVQFPLPYPAG